MKVNFAHICDYAMVSREGKLSVMGIFDRINVGACPAVHGAMYLAFEIDLHPAEMGRPFKIEIRLVDSDGGQVLSVSSELSIQGRSIPGDTVRVPQVLGFEGVQLAKPGRYGFSIFLNDDHKVAASFDVVGPESESPASQGLPR